MKVHTGHEDRALVRQGTYLLSSHCKDSKRVSGCCLGQRKESLLCPCPCEDAGGVGSAAEVASAAGAIRLLSGFLTVTTLGTEEAEDVPGDACLALYAWYASLASSSES